MFSAFLLFGSFALWAGLLRGPLLQRLDGRRASNAASARLGLQALLFALGLSAVAALLAIGGWISP